MGSHVAAGEGPASFDRSRVGGVVCFGYPVVAMGKTEPRSVTHLEAAGVRMLFVSGTRDGLGPLTLMRPLVAGLKDARLIEVPDGDHSLRVPKRSGRTADEVLDEVIAATASWIRQG